MQLRPGRSLSLVLLSPLVLATAIACSGGDSSASPTAVNTASPTAAVSTTPPVNATTPAPSPTPQPPPRPDASPFPSDLSQKAEQIFDAVAKLRGTEPKSDVDTFLMSRDQARAFYAVPQLDPNAVPGATTTPALDSKNELYRLLGLVPDRPDSGSVAQQSTDNLISQITGFYSPEYKAFYMLAEIIGGVNGPSAQATIAHEYVHALQDQYYDLNAIAAARANDWDGTRALQDLMEGDAIHWETAYMGYSLRSTYRSPVCFQIPQPQRNVPFVIERELDTWYEDGLCFFNAVLPQVPNGAASIWEDLPTTTEQILHPEKYLAHEGAKPVSLPNILPTLGSGWTELDHSNFGEFTLQNLLLLGLSKDRPGVQRAAAGWGGDAWTLYVKDNLRVLQAATVWDTPADAEEFMDALVLSLRQQSAYGDEGPPGDFTANIGDKIWRIALRGDNVSFIIANDAPTLDAVTKALGLP